MYKFKMFGGKVIKDLDQYVKDYVKSHKDIRIYVGTDSQEKAVNTTFATVICFRHYNSGAHIIFRRWSEKTFDMRTRLLSEITYSIEIAQHLHNTLESINFKPVEYKTNEFKFGPSNLVDVDIDVNPDPIHNSNKVFKEGVGMVKGANFRCRYKDDAWAASCAADLICS